jgi:hypothetical protein
MHLLLTWSWTDITYKFQNQKLLCYVQYFYMSKRNDWSQEKKLKITECRIMSSSWNIVNQFTCNGNGGEHRVKCSPRNNRRMHRIAQECVELILFHSLVEVRMIKNCLEKQRTMLIVSQKTFWQEVYSISAVLSNFVIEPLRWIQRCHS